MKQSLVNLIPDSINKFEMSYDAQLIDNSILNYWPTDLHPILISVINSNWEAVTLHAESAFNFAQGNTMQAFVLQWAVASCELRGDMQSREAWLRKWSEIINWQSEPYCKYLYAYHEGMSLFHKGILLEAQSRFSRSLKWAQIAKSIRGQIRGYFHLGLVQRDLENTKKSLHFFDLALQLAEETQSLKFIERIKTQTIRIHQLSNKSGPVKRNPATLDGFIIDIERALLQKKFNLARKTLCSAEQHRRTLGLQRRARSLYVYLPAIHAGMGRAQLSVRLLKNISDPILRIKAAELKKRTTGLTPSEMQDLNYTRELHGLSPLFCKLNSSPQLTEICGIELHSMLDSELRSLMELFIQHDKTLDKADICKHIWNFNYDPIIHDSKIYKLIYRARTMFGRTDLILNTYGGYRLNVS